MHRNCTDVEPLLLGEIRLGFSLPQTVVGGVRFVFPEITFIPYTEYTKHTYRPPCLNFAVYVGITCSLAASRLDMLLVVYTLVAKHAVSYMNAKCTYGSFAYKHCVY